LLRSGWRVTLEALLPVIKVVITTMTDFLFCELMSKACAMVNHLGDDPRAIIAMV